MPDWMPLTEEDLEDLTDDEIRNRLENEFQRPGTYQFQILSVLVDRNWHCRNHEFDHVNTGQIAGGGGIQGLERGTRSRPGFEIESEDRHCEECGQFTRHDRWTGRRQTAITAASISEEVKQRILEYYGHRDAIEHRVRQPHELVIDHRFPMERWGGIEETLEEEIEEDEILRKFQLLKDDGTGNHNQLKSRACEHCIETGERGRPLGINFWYRGGPQWPEGVPTEGMEAEKGCVGCGWYNFEKWRSELVEHLEDTQDTGSNEIDYDGTLLEDIDAPNRLELESSDN